MREDVVNFINENKKEIFVYFKKHSPFFPYCCVDVTFMLKHFLKEYFGEEFNIIEGKKKLYPNKTNFHLWLEKDDDVIDFCLFQFYIGWNKFKKVSPEDTFKYCILDIQRGDVIFNKEHYIQTFKERKPTNTNHFLNQYSTSLWDIPIDKGESPIISLRRYFDGCSDKLV